MEPAAPRHLESRDISLVKGLPGFREAVMRYFKALNKLGQSLVRPFSAALGMPENFLDDYFTDENNATLRMLHYPPTKIDKIILGQRPIRIILS